jgi:hypothetical protein
MIFFFRFILLNPFCNPDPRLVTSSTLFGLLDLNKMRQIYMARHCTLVLWPHLKHLPYQRDPMELTMAQKSVLVCKGQELNY